MRTLKSILLAGAMLLAIPAFFSSCQEDGTQLKYKVEVTVTNDFSKVVDAINHGTLKNEQAIAKLTAAIDKMNADQQTKLQAIKDVLNSVNATIDAKLAVIEAAMKAQTLSLEGKLALIEDAMKAQTLTIEKKCDALVAAIKALPDYTEKLQAIEKAISALPDYTAKLEAIEKALTSQTLELAEKLGFIQGALEDQTIAMKEKMDILKGVINDQTKAFDLRLGALETAMKNQTLELKDKLTLLNSTLETQTLTLANKLEAISSAVEAMPDYTSKLAAIETAIKALPNYEAQLKALNTLIEAQNSKLDDQIAALEGIMNAIPDYSNKLDAIENAIKAMPDYDAAINGIKDEIANLVKEVKDGNKSEADALAEIAKKLEELKAAGGSKPMPIPSNCVDLGLPSGLLWAKSNMGTTVPTEIGDYYAWGETSPKKKYHGNNYKHYTGSDLDIKKYNEKDWKTVLELEDDAANANLGVGYRIPTREDWQELLDNCKWEAVTTTLPEIMDPSQTKVIARWIVTGPNGKSIILPMTDSFRSDAWITSDEDTYYTTANLWPAEGLSDGKKYRKAVALAWPFFAKETSSGSIKKPTFRSVYRPFGVVVRPVFDRYSDK